MEPHSTDARRVLGCAERLKVWMPVRSEILLRSRRDPTSEYRTCDHLIRLIERVHDAFHPSLVDLNYVSQSVLNTLIAAIELAHLAHKLPHGVLSLLTIRIPGQTCRRTLRPRSRLIRRVRRIRRIRIHQQHELHIATSQQTMNVIVLVSVYAFEVELSVRPLDLFDHV